MITKERIMEHVTASLIVWILVVCLFGLTECCFAGHTVTERAVIREKLFVPGKQDSDGSSTPDRYYIIVEVDDGGEVVKVPAEEFQYLNWPAETTVRLHRRYGNWTGICYTRTLERE